MKIPNKQIYSYGVLFAGWILSLLIYFRNVVFSGFARIIGDPADGRLITSIHEHWYRWLNGLEGWYDLSFFFPLENTLGYSDTFLATGMAYSIFRFAGLEPFLSMQAILMLLATIGYFAMFFWLKRYRGFSVPVSSFCAALFIVASPMFLASRNSHIQLLSIWQFPLGIILIEQSIRKIRSEGRRLWIPLTLLCFWFGLLTYSTFYVAYFFGLLVLICLIGAFFAYGPKQSIRTLFSLRKQVYHLIPGLIILSLLAVLFVTTYLPVLRETGGRSMEVVLQHLPLPKDLINHSETNALWGKFAERGWDYTEFLSWELELGFTPVLFLILVCMSVVTLALRRNTRPAEWIAAFTFVLGTLLIVRIGNLSLWSIPYHLIPATEGIRAAFRFNLALLIPGIFLVASLFRILKAGQQTASRVAIICVGSILFLEQIQFSQNAKLPRTEILHEISRAATPPPNIIAFLAYRSSGDHWQQILVQHHAVNLSQIWNLPTLNGRSGFVPGGWRLDDLHPGNLQERVKEWSKVTGLHGQIGIYEINENKWMGTLHVEEPPPLVIDGIDLLNEPRAFLSKIAYGWSGREPWGIWSEAEKAGFKFPASAFPDRINHIRLEANGFVNELHPVCEVDIRLNGALLTTITFTPEKPHGVWELSVADPPQNLLHLEFIIRDPASPQSLGLHPDPRELGIGLISLRISSKNQNAEAIQP